MNDDTLISVTIGRPDDVFTLRQRGRDAAAALGMDEADQARVATALSEVGREVLDFGGSATFSLAPDGSLCVEVHGLPTDTAARAVGTMGLVAARRLMDEVSIAPTTSDGTLTVTLRKRVPAATGDSAKSRTVDSAALRAALEETAVGTPLDELLAQNRELVGTLDELTDRQEQLERLNSELEETNRGVMAMYTQLSDELEETNRGVVALYADLDDKTLKVKEASEAKSRFLASVSHELRSPVNSVLGLARLMLDVQSAPLSADQREQASLIVRSATDLLDLVNELLDLAKAESGRLQPAIGEVDLGGVFAELRGVLKPLGWPAVELVVEPPAVGVISTDRTLLIQVLRNLLSNALKFTENGEVRLAARLCSPQEVEIAVSDTGVGISVEDQERVFEEFFQVRGPLQARHKGSGLGLPYARRVTQTLGGELRLVSEPGSGTTFFVRLPRQFQSILGTPTTPTTPTMAERRAVAVGLGTAVIVDDDDGFRRILRGMLQGVAGRVIEASNGQEGLDLMAATVPDVIFLDLRMPDMDGAEVLAQLSADHRLRNVPVVIVTSAELDTATVARLGRATALMAKSTVSVDGVHSVLADLARQSASPS